MSELLEAMMVISFGLSWPMSIMKSYKSRTTRGKSILFISFILFGYACGIVSKIIGNNITYVFFFYVLNFIMVGVDIILYIRNAKIDQESSKNIA